MIRFLSSDPGRIQTCNPQSRNLMRYSVAPRGRYQLSVISYQLSEVKNLIVLQILLFKTSHFSLLTFLLTQFFSYNSRNGLSIGLNSEFCRCHPHNLSHILHS